MALTAEQRAARVGKLTASQVSVLMNGEPEAILNLWRLHIGDPNYQEENLDDIWAVQLGSHTESLSLDWYEKKHSRKLSRRGEVVAHKLLPWAACTLDGFDHEENCVVEAKHVGAFRKAEDVLAGYAAQTHWQMIVTETRPCKLWVIFGSNEPIALTVHFDQAYADELMSRAKAFWSCVESLTPPVALVPVAAPVPKSEWVDTDMSASNSWTSFAADWITHKDSSKKFEDAAKELKALVAKNCGRAYGAGIEIIRNGRGLTIKQTEEANV